MSSLVPELSNTPLYAFVSWVTLPVSFAWLPFNAAATAPLKNLPPPAACASDALGWLAMVSGFGCPTPHKDHLVRAAVQGMRLLFLYETHLTGAHISHSLLWVQWPWCHQTGCSLTLACSPAPSDWWLCPLGKEEMGRDRDTDIRIMQTSETSPAPGGLACPPLGLMPCLSTLTSQTLNLNFQSSLSTW